MASDESKINLELELLKKCSTYKYIADTKSKIYHADNCECLQTAKDLRGVGKKPEKDGYIPCSQCLMNKAVGRTLNAQASKKDRNVKTKAEIMKAQIIKVSESYGMHITIKGTFAFVTTIVGEWYFDYCTRPINLHHKNAEQRKSGDSYYHSQDVSLPSPTHALSYIRNHDQAAIKRIMEAENCKLK